MKRIEINAMTRKEKGKNEVKKLRSDKKVPAVMYGNKPYSFSVSSVDALKLYQARHDNFIIKLKIDDKEEKEALLKDIQLHPVNNSVVHLDFLELIAGKTITTRIPIELTGTPEGIKMGGIVEHFLWDLHIECLPKDIPELITADIENLQIGDSLHIDDLEIGEGIRVLDKAEQVILTIGLPTGMTEEKEEEEGEELEGEGVEGAEEGTEEGAEETGEKGKPKEKGKEEKGSKEEADKKEPVSDKK